MQENVHTPEKLSILEWNIHQQGGKGKGSIPSWVKEEVRGFDVIVLTEFCTKCDGRTAFLAALEQLGYACTASENSEGNDILIAVNSRFPIVDCTWTPCYGIDFLPENLLVHIDCGGKRLTVAGVRIKALTKPKMKSAEFRQILQKRKAEFVWTLNRLKDIQNPILLTGDFNNNRRGSGNKEWSLSVMEEDLKKEGFTLYTPKGSSIYEEESRYAEFPYDHFAVKRAAVSLHPYDRDFTRHDSTAYFLGRDFREPWYPGSVQSTFAQVSPSFPDHAILKGELFF